MSGLANIYMDRARALSAIDTWLSAPHSITSSFGGHLQQPLCPHFASF